MFLGSRYLSRLGVQCMVVGFITVCVRVFLSAQNFQASVFLIVIAGRVSEPCRWPGVLPWCFRKRFCPAPTPSRAEKWLNSRNCTLDEPKTNLLNIIFHMFIAHQDIVHNHIYTPEESFTGTFSKWLYIGLMSPNSGV